ncbi:fibroblast growth factor binding protein 2a [Polymixia lowei]
MWIQAGVLLLLACWLCPAADAQSIWDNPIRFNTKANDVCTMYVTGQGEYTRLRISCRGRQRSYWCEYLGKPHTCRTYNNRPRHYFTQMMWGLRKLQNACQAPRFIKPHMCRKETDESQMVFSSSSFSQQRPDTSRPVRPEQARPTRPDHPNPGPKTTPARKTPTPKPTTARPTTPAVESKAKKMAQKYCWRSLQGVCSYVIGWFL